MRRLHFIAAAGGAGLLLAALFAAGPQAFGGEADLTRINPQYLVTPEEAQTWHVFKDQGGPTFSGGPSWVSYMGFLEDKLKQYGVADITRNAWTYDRWHSSEWPDDSGWSLSVGGQGVKVAHYGAYSGSTPAEGLTADSRSTLPRPRPNPSRARSWSSSPRPTPSRRWTTSTSCGSP